MTRILQYYRLDPRALGLMRIGLSLVIIADLLIRWGDIQAFYTDQGIWPRPLIYHSGWKTGYWSIHDLSGEAWWQHVLFSLQMIFAILLMLGKWSRLSTVMVFLLYISLHNRNIYILQAGDDLIRLTLLWGFFMNWGSSYSLDKQKNQTATPAIAGLSYLLLIASVYTFTALLKTGADWHEDRSALYYALSLKQLQLPAGAWLLGFPGLLKILTVLVYWTEWLIPLLILVPGKKGQLRLAAFFLIVLLHAGIGLTLYVGLFYIISITSAIGLLPPSAMNRVDSILRVNRGESLQASGKKHYLVNSNCAIIAGLCIGINVSTLPSFEYELEDHLAVVTHVLRLDQNWSMFSPGVLRKDGWLVYYGRNTIGQQWDLRRNEDYVDFHEPENVVGLYKNDRWRKLTENMADPRFTFLRPQYCNYILDQWNLHHPAKQMSTLELYFVEREVQPDYQEPKINRVLYSLCNGS